MGIRVRVVLVVRRGKRCKPCAREKEVDEKGQKEGDEKKGS